MGSLIIGLVIGWVIGMVVGWNKIVREVLLPPVEFIRQMPLLALVSLFILWFGGREIGIYLYIIYGVSIMILMNTINALRNVPVMYIHYAETLGANRITIFKNVIIPAMIPEILGGLRVIIAVVWAIGMAGEYFMAQSGLGRVMIMSEYFQLTGQMIVITFLYIIFAYVIDNFVVWLFSKLIRWAPTLRNI